MLLYLRWVCGLSAALGLGLLAAGLVFADPRFALIGLGHLSVPALLFFPALSSRQVSPFDPLMLTLFWVITGAVMPAYFLAFGSGARLDFLMNGQDLDHFVVGAIWVVAGLLVTSFAYSATGGARARVERVIPNDAGVTIGGAVWVALLAIAVAWLAIFTFLQQTGGITGLEALSRKRTILIASEGGVSVHGSAAYLRALSQAVLPALIVVVGLALRRTRQFRPIAWVATAALVLSAAALPFFTSSRSETAFVFLALALALYASNALRPRHVLVGLIVAGTLFGAMTGLRSIAQNGPAESLIVNPVVGIASAGNGMSVIATSHIMAGVPGRMDYRLGSTYLTWVTAPIPRSMWPNKPDPSLGKDIRAEILGHNVLRSGMPPSILTEGHINFGWPGFFVAALAFGALLRFVANTFLPLLRANVFAPAVYYVALVTTAGLTTSSVSQGIVRALTDLTMAAAVIVLLRVLSPQPRIGAVVGARRIGREAHIRAAQRPGTQARR